MALCGTTLSAFRSELKLQYLPDRNPPITVLVFEAPITQPRLIYVDFPHQFPDLA
jgi:hypothetical protein